MQKLIILHGESAIAGAAILSNLTLIPSFCSFLHWDRKNEINKFVLGYLWNIKCSRDLGQGRRRRAPGFSGRVIAKTDLRSQIFLPVDEKPIQSLSNITFVSNDFTLLG